MARATATAAPMPPAEQPVTKMVLNGIGIVDVDGNASAFGR